MVETEGDSARPSRNPDWTWDEVVLACALVSDNGWRSLSATDQRVIALSEQLRRLDIHRPVDRGTDFRNANGVARKTADIATQHPDYKGKPTHGGRHDRAVLLEFLRDPDRMAAIAAALRTTESDAGAKVLPRDVDLDASAEEGTVLERRHLYRERSPRLRGEKIAAARSDDLPVACEVCGFDFEATYGARGADYIEVHHRLPLHASGPRRTSLADLAFVCANCHRMIHRTQPWLPIEQLRELVKAKSSRAPD